MTESHGRELESWLSGWEQTLLLQETRVRFSHVQQFFSACDSSSRESSYIYWPLCTCVHMHMYTSTDIHHTNRKTKIFLTSYKFHVDWLFGPLGYCGLRNVIFPLKSMGYASIYFYFLQAFLSESLKLLV